MGTPESPNAEQRATVCLPCPKCGHVIRDFAARRVDTHAAVFSARCPVCGWSDSAEVFEPHPPPEGAVCSTSLQGLAVPVVESEALSLSTLDLGAGPEAQGVPRRRRTTATVVSRPRIHRSRRDAAILTVVSALAVFGGLADLLLIDGYTEWKWAIVGAIVIPLAAIFGYGVRAIWRSTH